MMDTTGAMERKGNVYPYMKAAGMGYGYGHKKEDDFDGGVCGQIAPDCGGWRVSREIAAISFVMV